MSKMALTGDVHIGARTSREVQHNQDTKDFFAWMIDVCHRRGVDELSLAGDLFEHRDKITLQSLSDATDIFSMCSSSFDQVTVLRGNHDLARLDALTPCSLEPFSRYFDLVFDYKIDHDRKIMWTSWICTPEQFDTVCLLTKKHGIKVLIGHFEFSGFMFNDHALCEHGLNLSALSHVPLIITGHFHTTQERTLTSTGTRCIYMGSPFPTTFTEQNGKHGFWILDTDTLEMEQVIYDKIKFMDVTPQQLLEGNLELAEHTNVRVVITEEPDNETISKIEEALASGGFRDSKLAHKFQKTEDAIAQQEGDISIGEVKSVDEVVINHLGNLDGTGNKELDTQLLQKLYRKAIEGASA